MPETDRMPKEKNKLLSTFIINNALYIVMFILLAVIVLLQPSFLRLQNFYFIVTQSSTKLFCSWNCEYYSIGIYRPFAWQKCRTSRNYFVIAFTSTKLFSENFPKSSTASSLCSYSISDGHLFLVHDCARFCCF